MQLWTWALLLLIFSPDVKSYRILGFFPFPATSHQNSIAPILHSLAARGHEVVYLTPVPPKLSHPNLKLKLIKPFIKEYLELLDLTRFGVASMPFITQMLSSVSIHSGHLFYGDPIAQEIIHSNDTYDAVLMESSFTQEPTSALIHKFGCVGIDVSTMGDVSWLNELSGLPDNPSFQLDFKAITTDDMTFFQRLYNFYTIWSTTLVSYYYLYQMQSLMDQYFNYTGWESRPPITTLLSNRSIVLINQDVLLGYPYPLAPHAKQVGGVNLVPNKPLPQNIKKFLDEAPNGFIYFSLGSNLNTSEEITKREFGNAFFKNFQELPQRVIMKWEADTVPAFVQKNKNIMTSKWLPQQDILAHQNCALFITHGGYQSLSEAVYHGVPLVGVPFFGDQQKNLLQVNAAGFGIMLMQNNVTFDSVHWALREVLDNPRYGKEAKRRSGIMRERRYTGLEDAVYWVEFGIKYPNFLTPRSAFLPFYQLHQLDIYGFLFACLLVIYKATSILLSFVISKPPKRKEKKH